MRWALLIAAFLVPGGLVLAFFAWWFCDRSDDHIDDLIAMNKYRPCDGMESVDIHLINRIGKRNAEHALASVERTRVAERLTRRLHEQRTKVLRFKSQRVER